jgi:hypothetical protein
MGNSPRKDPTEERRARELPPCEQAQSDGVPCPEVGRDCEICEAALAAEPDDPRDEVPTAPHLKGRLPKSGA